MEGWTETWRGIVAPWECDITEHFTIAYYFDRLADATAIMAGSLGLDGASPSAGRRFDVRFVRELRAGASFHILSAPIALDEASLRLGHQFVDSANGEVTAWVEETLDIAAREIAARRLATRSAGVCCRGPVPRSSDGRSRAPSKGSFRRRAIASSRSTSTRMEILHSRRLSIALLPAACRRWRRSARRLPISRPSARAFRHSSLPCR